MNIIVDDVDPTIIYNGTWDLLGNPGKPFNGTLHRGNAANQSLSYTFKGIGVSIYGNLEEPAIKGLPDVQFQVDDGPAQLINSSLTPFTSRWDQTISHRLVFRSNNLTDGLHTININIMGSRAPFYFDFLTIETGADTKTGNIILDDQHASIRYTPRWNRSSTMEEYLGGSSRVQKNGSYATLEFSGEYIELSSSK